MIRPRADKAAVTVDRNGSEADFDEVVGRPRSGGMRAALALLLHGLAAVVMTLLTTFGGERPVVAVYPDVMGCEAGCVVVGTGWPLTFVRDYLGMSVIDTANIMEVWFAADRFAWLPFFFDAGVWSLVFWAASSAFRRLRLVGRKRASPSIPFHGQKRSLLNTVDLDER